MSFEKRYKQSLNEIQESVPAPDMLAQVKEDFTGGTTRPRRLGVKLGGLAALAAAAAGAVLMMTPTKADALEAMQMALRSVPASHTTYYDAKGALTTEFWNEGVKRRYKTAFDRSPTDKVSGARYIYDRGFDGKNVWEWMDGPKVAIISDEKPEGFGMDSRSIEDSIKTIKTYATELKVTSVKDTVTIEGLTGQKKPFRQVIQCESGKPISSLFYAKKGDAWVLNASMKIDYPADIPDSLFEFNPPKDFVVCDHRIAKKAIFDGVAGKGETKTVEGVQIRLIGAFHQPGGSVVVLWTGGDNPHVDGMAGVEGMTSDTVVALHQQTTTMAERAAAMKALKTKVPFGADETRPLETGPLLKIGHTPVYAFQASAPFGSGSLRVKIPVFKKGEVRIKQVGNKGAFYVSTGMPVGVAEFDAPVYPVDSFYRFINFDRKMSFESFGVVPLLPAE